MSKLKDKVAIVTGASKGIGAAIATSLAAEGASVVVNYASSQAGAEAVVARINAAGGKAVAVRGDVSKPADAQAIVDAAIKHFGRLDILVNNSGVYGFAPLEEISEEEFHRQFNVNVLGLLLTTQAAAKHLGEGSSIINIGSVVSRITPPGSAVYTGTKGAVDAITGVLSRELGGRKIRVNALNPGMIETEGTHTAGFIGTDIEAGTAAQTPLGRIGQPDDIASIAAWPRTTPAGLPASSCWPVAAYADGVENQRLCEDPPPGGSSTFKARGFRIASRACLPFALAAAVPLVRIVLPRHDHRSTYRPIRCEFHDLPRIRRRAALFAVQDVEMRFLVVAFAYNDLNPGIWSGNGRKAG